MTDDIQRAPARHHDLPAVVRAVVFRPWSMPLALLALVLLGYGLRALSLGFFWDDWPYLWMFHSLGPEGIAGALAQDRPFLSFIYITTLSALGSSTVAWQVFALVARWLCCVGLWWALAQAWPESSHKAFWAAALFAVYPGFTQQWIAIIYGQAFLLFASTLFSLGVTLWLARSRARISRPALWSGTVLALALSTFSMFSTEYFFGLELLRPMLLWIVLAPRQEAQTGRALRGLWNRGLRVLRWWAPYLALMAAFIVWRGVIHTFPGRGLSIVERMGQSPLQTLTGLALTIAEDFVEAALLAWGQTMSADTLTGWASTRNLRLPALMLGAGVLAWFYLLRLRPVRIGMRPVATGERSITDDHWGREAVVVGVLAFFAAGWPFWVTALPMRMGFPQDRYSLPLAVGVCLLLAGLVDLAGRAAAWKAAALALPLALAIGFHSQATLAYRQDWSRMQEMFWQLTWRAPGIQPDTLLLTDSLGLRYYEDDSLTAPLNWTYDPDNGSPSMGYMLLDLYVRQNSLTDLSPGVAVTREFRGKTFRGSTSQALVLVYDPPGCLAILDPAYDLDLPGLPARVLRALPLSAPGRWVTPTERTATPPVEIFDVEPRRRWCYYFEKASLARQVGDWEEVVRLSGESIRKGIRPERPQDQGEFLPFIEGYIQVMRWEDAAELTFEAFNWEPELRPALCAVWKRGTQGKDAGDRMSLARQSVLDRLRCAAP